MKEREIKGKRKKIRERMKENEMNGIEGKEKKRK